MCLTNNKKLYERMRVFKHHGMRQPGVYLHEVVGYNYRLTNVQSAIGCAQFERIGEFLEKRKKLGDEAFLEVTLCIENY